MLTGIAMGSTAIALVFSPLGKRSGAHFNPAVTLTFWRLGKVKNWDAVFYVIAQFVGAIAGVFAVTLFVSGSDSLIPRSITQLLCQACAAWLLPSLLNL